MNRKTTLGIASLAILAFVIAVVGCVGKPAAPSAPSPATRPSAVFALTSSAFEDGQPLPQKYTADGDDISPPLKWSHTPAGTQQFAIIVEDPDAANGPWVHWIAYHIPASINGFEEGVSGQDRNDYPDAKINEGETSLNRTGYHGPMPPPGTLHHYVFRIYAIDTTLSLPRLADKPTVLKAMEGHILAQASITGTYQR